MGRQGAKRRARRAWDALRRVFVFLSLRRGVFILEIREPFAAAEKDQIRSHEIRAGRRLADVAAEIGVLPRWVWVNGAIVRDWRTARPRRDDRVILFPRVGMKSFSSAYLEKINSVWGGGKILKAVEITESTAPLVKRYYVDHERELTIAGNIYKPLEMEWSGLEINAGMIFPRMRAAVANVGGEVIDIVEELDLLENDVEFQFVHLDLLQIEERVKLQLQAISADNLVAIFECGFSVGPEDKIPRTVMTRAKYPGLPETPLRFLQ